MSTLTSLARAQAQARDIAQPVATVRHVHVTERPLVFIPLALAGEANAPLAALVGDDPDAPRLLAVSQPRNRDQRFAFAAELAHVIVPYLEDFALATEEVASGRGQTRPGCLSAPQVVAAEPGRDRLHATARPVDQVPEGGRRLPGGPGRAIARPLAVVSGRAG